MLSRCSDPADHTSPPTLKTDPAVSLSPSERTGVRGNSASKHPQPPAPSQVAVAWLGAGHGLHDALAHPGEGRLVLTQTPPHVFSPPGQPQYVP